MQIYEVALRNGAKVPNVAVSATMLALENLLDAHPMYFYELVMVARGEVNRIAGDSDVLVKQGLLTRDGKMHDITRDIILSAVEGEGISMTLISPYAKE